MYHLSVPSFATSKVSSSTFKYLQQMHVNEYNIIIFISTTMARPLPLGIPNPAGVSIQTNVEHILAATAKLLPSCCGCCCSSVSVSVSGNWSYKLNGMLNTLHSCNLCPNEINLWTSIAKLIRRKPTTTTTRRRRVAESDSKRLWDNDSKSDPSACQPKTKCDEGETSFT